ncbi:hypothetical protein GJ496_005647 [Pomphorhynchus laevis]|nr:hypothetical protein GJ496_005647 [Pomphorhynchus laevis]
MYHKRVCLPHFVPPLRYKNFNFSKISVSTMGNKSQHERPFQPISEEMVQYLTNVTQFNRKQIIAYYNGFYKDCPGGILTERQLIRAYKTIQPSGNPKQMAKAVFKAIDTNHDGKISFQEYIIAIALIRSGNQ